MQGGAQGFSTELEGEQEGDGLDHGGGSRKRPCIARPSLLKDKANYFLALALALRAACMKLSKRFSATENH